MTTAEVELLDTILAAVAYRSTVYAHEIAGPLSEMLQAYYHDGCSHEDCGDDGIEVFYALQAIDRASSTINGDTVVHSREFLNILLDLRNDLTKETT